MNRLPPSRFEDVSSRIGYRFQDQDLLVEALTHGSTQKHSGNYQRLEFLGDRVLGLIIAEHLFRTYPGHGEGELTAMLSGLVRGQACAAAGDTIGLSDFMIIGTGERAASPVLLTACALLPRCRQPQLRAVGLGPPHISHRHTSFTHGAAPSQGARCH